MAVVVLGFGTLGLQQCNAEAYGRVAVGTPTSFHINERILTGGFFPYTFIYRSLYQKGKKVFYSTVLFDDPSMLIYVIY